MHSYAIPSLVIIGLILSCMIGYLWPITKDTKGKILIVASISAVWAVVGPLIKITIDVGM